MDTNLQRLQSRHLRILELVLAGSATVDVARELGMSPIGVGRIINSPLFQHALAQRRASLLAVTDQEGTREKSRAREKLENAAERAVDVLVELLDSESDTTKLKCALAITDRTLPVAGAAGQKGGATLTLNVKDSQLLLVALTESRVEEEEDESLDRGVDDDVVEGELAEGSGGEYVGEAPDASGPSPLPASESPGRAEG